MSWHLSLALLCAGLGAVCWTIVAIAAFRTADRLPPPSHHCKRNPPEAVCK